MEANGFYTCLTGTCEMWPVNIESPGKKGTGEAPGLYNCCWGARSGVRQIHRRVEADLGAVRKEIVAIVPSNVNIL